MATCKMYNCKGKKCIVDVDQIDIALKSGFTNTLAEQNLDNSEEVEKAKKIVAEDEAKKKAKADADKAKADAEKSEKADAEAKAKAEAKAEKKKKKLGKLS